MNKYLFVFVLALFAIRLQAQQNPGLLISEIMANPASTDSCKEYVELLATKSISFNLTPYTVIVNNNGNATSQGWISGGALSYAFEITTGTVNAGDVVYVGGSCMAPSTNILRAINVKYTNGDNGMGTAAAAGVFGNGGGNADGVAVFSVGISSIANNTIPVDAVFYGTGVGSASVTGGTDGYELPVSDLYAGGKFKTASFYGPDPGSDELIKATGLFNTNTNTWNIPRTFAATTASSNAVSDVSLTTAPPAVPATVSFFSNDTTVSEAAGAANVYVRLTSTSTASSAITISVSALSTAAAADYAIPAITLTFAANAPVNSTYPVNITVANDALAESSEYVVLRFANPQNANIGSISQFAFYIADNDKAVPAPSNALTLNLLSSFTNAPGGSNSAEIVVHDPATQRLYIANSIGGKLDIVNFVNPSSPSLISSIPITSYGNINSVAVYNGTVAAAIENSNPQDSGRVVFFNQDGVFQKQVKVGMMPDMITFNHAGTKVLTANEGEPNQAYTNDPDGSVSIVDISGGIANLTQANVAHATFTVYNGQEAALRAQGIRIYGLNANAAKDFEPEYIAIAKDDSKAWVTLQENNAIAEINLTTNSVTALRPLGSKNHMLTNNGMDMSNVTRSVNIANFPVKGLYLPDAIATYTVGGVNYVITANEGDARAYSGFSEEQRVSALNLDAAKFPLATQLKNNYLLGRLTVTDKAGDFDNDGDIDTIFAYGSRSFSIWNANTGVQVYDSKDDFEMITATNSYSVLFNASNANNTKKDRSDDKGPEPEGVTIGEINGNMYAFIALERTGGVMVYDVTNPAAPVFVTYVNNRNTAVVGPDLGAEGLVFIPQSKSPNGQHLVIAANEVSSSLSIWGIAGCSSPISSSLSVAGAMTNACSGNPPVISVPNSATLTYQWSRNGSAIPGATLNTVPADQSGTYSVAINGGVNCSTGSLLRTFTVNATPTLAITGPTAACVGSSVALTASGATSYTWNNNYNGNTMIFFPIAQSVYTISGSANNCVSTITRTVAVNQKPAITINGGVSAVCANDQVILTASGATTYSWNVLSAASSITVYPSVSSTYVVDGTDSKGCTNSASKTVSVNALPVLSVTGPSVPVCSGQSAALNVTGATTYTWSHNNSNASAINVTPAQNTTYTVSGSGANGCVGKTTQGVNVYALPVLNVSASSTVLCIGESATVNVSGAGTYGWSDGSQGSKVVLTPTASTSYTITGTDFNTCSSIAALSLTVSECTSINELKAAAEEFNMFPNPASTELKLTLSAQDNITVAIYNSVGALVKEELNYTSGDVINIQGLSKGVYLVQVKSGTATSMKKLIVE